MLKIRLQRVGRKNSPSYRVVVGEHTIGPKSGKFLETLGSYNPKTKMRTLSAERIQYWLSKGAQASGTVHNMLVSANVISGKKINVLPKKSPPKKEETAESVAPVASAPVQETPAEQAPEVETPVAAAESETPSEEVAA